MGIPIHAKDLLDGTTDDPGVNENASEDCEKSFEDWFEGEATDLVGDAQDALNGNNGALEGATAEAAADAILGKRYQDLMALEADLLFPLRRLPGACAMGPGGLQPPNGPLEPLSDAPR